MASTVNRTAVVVPAIRGRSVSVEQLPLELARLWAEVSAQVEAEHQQIPIQTNVLTLIAVARGPLEQRIVRDTLQHLAEVQPSRAIAVYIDNVADKLSADISAMCRPATDGRITCYEVVELHAPPQQLDALPSVLHELELYDLPSFIWWVGEVDLRSNVFRSTARLVERVIIDTSRCEDAAAVLQEYAAFLGQEGNTCTASDLTWARATSWREIVAQSFDSPLARDLLWGIQNVEIDFDPPAETQALLFAGWLASRLGWDPVLAERRGSTLRAIATAANGSTVAVALNRQASAGSSLRSIRILARDGTSTARMTIRRRDDRLASVLMETPGIRQERVIPDARPGIPDLVSAELLAHTRDRVFVEALRCATHWLSTLKGNA
ncbi:MAG: hypothetical protein DCC58_08920 [Chloroflexi bacterium]|nr:MAG: hypothetical protein DCC58_08920 [Chloroflexota bacterium]